MFTVPPRKPGSRGPAPSAARADRDPKSIATLIDGLDSQAWQTIAFRDISGGQLASRIRSCA